LGTGGVDEVDEITTDFGVEVVEGTVTGGGDGVVVVVVVVVVEVVLGLGLHDLTHILVSLINGIDSFFLSLLLTALYTPP